MIHSHACPPRGPCKWCRSKVPLMPGAKTKPAKRGLCVFLGDKLDGPRQAPCRCRYACEAGEPFAVPAGVCQRCPKFEPQ